jgi:hypothetical protein
MERNENGDGVTKKKQKLLMGNVVMGWNLLGG